MNVGGVRIKLIIKVKKVFKFLKIFLAPTGRFGLYSFSQKHVGVAELVDALA